MTTISISRTDTSILGRWWWTVDRLMLAAVVALIGIGVFLVMAAGPAAASRINVEAFHFVRRQAVFLPMALAVMLFVSLLDPRTVRRLAVVGFAATLVALTATLFIGTEIKGAARWIHLGPLSIQPSEFIKPFFAVTAAWMFSAAREHEAFPGQWISIALYGVVAVLLLAQPDVGMTLVVSSVWAAQFFLAGLPMILVVLFAAAGLGAAVGAYFLFDHVKSRVDRFLDPASGDTYQIDKAMQAFRDGGLFGRGPGEGRVKELLPDAHTDFIFAVAGEEFGLLLCLVIVGLFGFIVLRGISRAMQEENLFVLLAVGGLVCQFGLQALINMASSLHLMPTKGMTLPFVSYGGSSTLALALGFGMLLALTRKRPAGGGGL
jgi:cell division protein FtsW